MNSLAAPATTSDLSSRSTASQYVRSPDRARVHDMVQRIVNIRAGIDEMRRQFEHTNTAQESVRLSLLRGIFDSREEVAAILENLRRESTREAQLAVAYYEKL